MGLQAIVRRAVAAPSTPLPSDGLPPFYADSASPNLSFAESHGTMGLIIILLFFFVVFILVWGHNPGGASLRFTMLSCIQSTPCASCCGTVSRHAVMSSLKRLFAPPSQQPPSQQPPSNAEFLFQNCAFLPVASRLKALQFSREYGPQFFSFGVIQRLFKETASVGDFVGSCGFACRSTVLHLNRGELYSFLGNKTSGAREMAAAISGALELSAGKIASRFR